MKGHSMLIIGIGGKPMLSKGVGLHGKSGKRKNPLMNGAWQPGKDSEEDDGEEEGPEHEAAESSFEEESEDTGKMPHKGKHGLHIKIEFGPKRKR